MKNQESQKTTTEERQMQESQWTRTGGIEISWVTIDYRGIERRVWRYQRSNQNPYIEGQTTQWQKEKWQKGKQWSTKHTHKTKDRVTWTALKTGDELGWSGRLNSSCSTSGTRRVNLVTNPVISREWGKNREVFTTSGTYPWSVRIPNKYRRLK